MTKRRVTISVPPDVAETLERQGTGKASAYVTEAVRGHRRWGDFCAMLSEAGAEIPTDQGMAAARARRLAGQTEWPEERYAALQARVQQHLGDKPVGGQASVA
jgi:hypothetical protein